MFNTHEPLRTRPARAIAVMRAGTPTCYRRSPGRSPDSAWCGHRARCGQTEPPVPLPRLPGMRIREENCNMVLLAVVSAVSVAIAGGATLLGDNKPLRLADRTTGRFEQTSSPDKRIIN